MGSLSLISHSPAACGTLSQRLNLSEPICEKGDHLFPEPERGVTCEATSMGAGTQFQRLVVPFLFLLQLKSMTLEKPWKRSDLLLGGVQEGFTPKRGYWNRVFRNEQEFPRHSRALGRQEFSLPWLGPVFPMPGIQQERKSSLDEGTAFQEAGAA